MPKMTHGKPVDEEKWERAKQIAAKQGYAENYGYIMSIYKKMVHISKSAYVIKLEH